MNRFHFVYILISEKDSTKHYTGISKDLEDRLKRHNAGEIIHTRKYRPWRIDTAIAFSDKKKAVAFEKYLKSHSGRSFAKRHF